MDILIDGLILMVIFLALFSGHWLPWRVIPALVDAQGDLKRVPAYIYGVVCILAGFAAWCAVQGPSVTPSSAFAWLVADVAAAGAGTVLPRVLRWVLEQQAMRGDLEDLQNGATKSKRN